MGKSFKNRKTGGENQQNRIRYDTEISVVMSYLTCNQFKHFLISNFHCVMNVVFLLLGDSPACEFYVLMYQNILSVPSSYLV